MQPIDMAQAARVDMQRAFLFLHTHGFDTSLRATPMRGVLLYL
jgi:hypothetical protein